MGAEHKLDLTSDVTHLLVGDTDTPKYKYVAKEREDVQVLKPEWVDAVRQQWMAAKHIDLDAMYVQYRMPPLAGLKICITGFDDLTFRAQLQKNVIEDGGEYTGDLTKDVTHLIARRPEGKKYEYGTQWQKKIVSLKWYKDTRERGMQLDESSYHPSIPEDEQGVGAWTRGQRPSSQLGKRSRDEKQAPGPPRKLRRTASARLHSQTDNMWSELTTTDAEQGDLGDNLKATKSMPDLRAGTVANGLDESAAKDHPAEAAEDRRAFSGKYFVTHGFNAEREGIVKKVIHGLGGVLLDSINHLRKLESVDVDDKVLLVPYQTPLQQLPAPEGEMEFQAASELWVEHCMLSKSFALPNTYPLGQLLPKTKPPGFSKLVVTSTGFSGLMPNHIAKLVQLLGAKYEQTFTRNTSILLCNQRNQNQGKLSMAKAWSIPAVAESWLWACIRDRRRASLEAHAIYLPKTVSTISDVGPIKNPLPNEQTESTAGIRQAAPADQTEPADPSAAVSTRHGGQPSAKTDQVERPGSDFRVHTDTSPSPMRQQEVPVADQNTRKQVHKLEEVQPLQSISHNCASKRLSQEATKLKKRLFQPFDGPSSDAETRDVPVVDAETADPRKPKLTSSVTEAQSLNIEIKELLDMKTKLKEKASEGTTNGSKPKKKLMGRALSNLSNASSTSHARQSRASSVDSVNTDGVGSEIGLSASNGSKAGDKMESGLGFIGRARSKLQEGRSSLAGEIAAACPEPEDGYWSEEAQAPPLTQLVYEDPAEAIQLREQLAAKRRSRSKLGQKDSDPKPTVQRTAEPKRIQDDDLVVSAGWGGGRRTRQKDKSPPGLKDF